jgi:tRNA threonylcarbamoyladenosine biosynthesis protein TsaB
MQSNKNFLVIDTAYSGFTIGIHYAGQKFLYQEDTSRDQASNLLPQIDLLLKKTLLNKTDLDFIVVSRGPGSFTGIRLGIAAAQAIGLALNIPVYGISIFDVLNYSAQKIVSHTENYFLVMETYKDYYYVQSVNQTEKDVSEIFFLSKEQISEIIVSDSMRHYFGNTHLDFVETLQKRQGIPLVSRHHYPKISGDDFIDHVSSLDFENNEQYSVIDPIYLRPADVSESKKKQRVLLKKP